MTERVTPNSTFLFFVLLFCSSKMKVTGKVVFERSILLAFFLCFILGEVMAERIIPNSTVLVSCFLVSCVPFFE